MILKKKTISRYRFKKDEDWSIDKVIKMIEDNQVNISPFLWRMLIKEIRDLRKELRARS